MASGDHDEFDESLYADLTPIEQDDGPHPVVPINYTKSFTLKMNYFRAILKANEKSERALKLTETAIDLNAANYTAWAYRRECLVALKKDLCEELQYTFGKAQDTPKNYQLWYHRRAIVDIGWSKCTDAVEIKDLLTNEYKIISQMLSEDSKNYHVWSYRHWLLKTFQMWDYEFEFVDAFLVDDVRNNSAWNHRFWVIEQTTGWTEEVCSREIQYCAEKISLAPRNESPWNYLRGLLKYASAILHDVIEKQIRTHFSENNRFGMGLLVSILQKKGNTKANQEALELCEELASKVDVIRYRYWWYIRDQIKQNKNSPNVVISENTTEIGI